MAVTLVQSTESTVEALTITETFSAATTPGNTLVLAICDWPGGGDPQTTHTTFTTTGFTQIETNVNQTQSNQVDAAYAYQNSITGGSTNYTFGSSSGFPWAGLAEFSGLTIYGLDYSITTQPTSTSASPVTITGNSPATSGEFVVCGAFTAAVASMSFTTPSGWNLLAEYPNGSTSNYTRGAVYWQIGGAAGSAAPSCTFTWTPSEAMSFFIASYQTVDTNTGATTWLIT